MEGLLKWKRTLPFAANVQCAGYLRQFLKKQFVKITDISMSNLRCLFLMRLQRSCKFPFIVGIAWTLDKEICLGSNVVFKKQVAGWESANN